MLLENNKYNRMTYKINPFPHTTILQQTTLNIVCQKIENLYNWMDNKKWKTLWQKEKLHVLCNFFFCHYVFKKPSAAEASESVYMRERVKPFPHQTLYSPCRQLTFESSQVDRWEYMWENPNQTNDLICKNCCPCSIDYYLLIIGRPGFY